MLFSSPQVENALSFLAENICRKFWFQISVIGIFRTDLFDQIKKLDALYHNLNLLFDFTGEIGHMVYLKRNIVPMGQNDL